MVVSQIHFADEITLFTAFNYFSSGWGVAGRGARRRSAVPFFEWGLYGGVDTRRHIRFPHFFHFRVVTFKIS